MAAYIWRLGQHLLMLYRPTPQGASTAFPKHLSIERPRGSPVACRREMTREALDIILRLWSEGEFDHKGKYWHVTKTGTMLDTPRPHITPLQKPHPPIAVAGVSKGSDTLKLAGERGF